MRILYVARHGQLTSNDDEGAVLDAFTQLGHEVQCVLEVMGHTEHRLSKWADFALFHKWDGADYFPKFSCPKVCWFWDLVEWPGDATLDNRSSTRVRWMQRTLPLVDMVLLSDGDYAEKLALDCPADKVQILRQGADQRVMGRGCAGKSGQILFTGIGRGGGKDRVSFVEEMAKVYGTDFRHIEKGLHGRQLANAVASHAVVVAPDSPVTDRYWSNRIYLMLGYGAFLLHPYAQGVMQEYRDGEELVLYRGRDDLHAKIQHYLKRPGEGYRIGEAGLRRTMAEHTYLHRVARLVEMVKERLM